MRTYIQMEYTNTHELPVEFQDDDVRYSDSIVEYFLCESTQEKDIVFDTFAGFGTTILVAEVMGRKPLSLEFDEERSENIVS